MAPITASLQSLQHFLRSLHHFFTHCITPPITGSLSPKLAPVTASSLSLHLSLDHYPHQCPVHCIVSSAAAAITALSLHHCHVIISLSPSLHRYPVPASLPHHCITVPSLSYCITALVTSSPPHHCIVSCAAAAVIIPIIVSLPCHCITVIIASLSWPLFRDFGAFPQEVIYLGMGCLDGR